MPDGGQRLRAFTAGLGTETNTFSSLQIDMDDFSRTCLYRPGEHPDDVMEISAPLAVLRERKTTRGWDLVEGTYAFALPAGRVSRACYELLRDEILGQLDKDMPYDMVALSLHGAMCAFGYDDCEGDLLVRVREIVGDETPIGVELDPHSHLSCAMIDNADILIAFKEYPHTDFMERGVELIDLLERCARTGWRPAKAVYDCHTIGRFHTTRQPMKAFVSAMVAEEQRPGIASVSLIHGFPWGDVADMGAKCVVFADEPEMAINTSRKLGQQLVEIRGQSYAPPLPLEKALEEALSYSAGPVVLADISDNPGGGAPGDSTELLQLLLQRDNIRTCLGPFWDPAAAELACMVGVGGKCQVRLGGKAGPESGKALDLEVEVTGVSEAAFQTWAATKVPLGRACALRVGQTSIVVSSVRDQAYDPDLFSGLGIDPTAHQIVAVKSAQHFVAGFTAIARAIIFASGGGSLEADFRKIPYQNISRPIWPLDHGC